MVAATFGDGAMTGGSSVAHRETPPQTYGTIVVVGGGCYGSDYVRQLTRARRAGALDWKRLIVVDRSANCAITGLAEFSASGAELHVADWSRFFDEYLSAGADEPATIAHDATVPSPLMPHLMYEWLVTRARRRWPQREIGTRPLAGPLSVPWQRAAPDGTHYASFADWICPVHCIEPAICPHTRTARDWSFPTALAEYVGSERKRGAAIDGPVIFHCVHRAYGVGMFDTAAVVAGDAYIAARGSAGLAEVLVGTVSHCHAALNVLTIGAPAATELVVGSTRDAPRLIDAAAAAP